jgi:hypothetical protein
MTYSGSEWNPRSYILQISHRACISCQTVETSSQLYLVSEHCNRRDLTRRTEANYLDSRLPRGTSERTTSVPCCTKCFTPYEPVYVCRDEDLIVVTPGDPSKRLIKSLEDII